MIGEHIRTRRDGRWSHAIDCGDETVIHLAEEAGPGAPRVRRSYRPEFVSGAEAVETVTHRERTFPPGEVVARAYSRFADPALAAMFRDSEAFAAWCETGRLPAGPANLALPAMLPEPAPPAARPSGSPGRKGASRAAPRKARPTPRPAAAKAKAVAAGKAKRPAAKAKRKAPAPKRRARPRRSRRR
jgi:hypothetical protein